MYWGLYWAPYLRKHPYLLLCSAQRLRVLVEALNTFRDILKKVAPAHELTDDWEALAGCI